MIPSTKEAIYMLRIKTDYQEETLYSAFEDIGLTVIFHSTGKPTYWPTNVNEISDLLYVFVTRKVSLTYVNVENGLGLAVDHYAIITLSDKVIIKGDILPAERSHHWKNP